MAKHYHFETFADWEGDPPSLRPGDTVRVEIPLPGEPPVTYSLSKVQTYNETDGKHKEKQMYSIWKFKLDIINEQTIKMPQGAVILDVQVQNGQPCLWAKVDPKAPQEPRTFITCGTGHGIRSDPGVYIGTYQLEGGKLVFHLFEAVATQ